MLPDTLLTCHVYAQFISLYRQLLTEVIMDEGRDSQAAGNRPRSIYQYSIMALRLSGQTSIFGVVFFVSKSLLGIERQNKLDKFTILTRKPRSHA